MSNKLIEILLRSEASEISAHLDPATRVLLNDLGSAAATKEGIAFLLLSSLTEVGVLSKSEIRNLLFQTLKPEETASLCGLLGLPPYAASMTLDSVDFSHDAGNLKILCNWFAVSYEIEGENVFDRENSRKASSLHRLREHQIIAYQKLRKHISDPITSALVHMPFGAGKMRLVATAVLDLYRSEPDESVIVWLAPSEALCVEAFDELFDVWHHLGSRDITIFRLYGSRTIPDLENLKNCIIVADVSKLWGKTGLAKIGKNTRVLVLGDAELVGHLPTSEVIKRMMEFRTFNIIGISASAASVIEKSPFRDAFYSKFRDLCIALDSSDPIAYLERTGNRRKVVFDRIILQKSNISIRDDEFEISEEGLQEIGNDVKRNARLLEFLVEERKTSKKIVFFAATAEHARLFAGLLMLRGVRAMAVTGQSSPEMQIRSIQKFNAQNGNVLCVHGFFVDGENVPELGAAVIARPTLSEAVFNQTIGRLASYQTVPLEPLKIILVDDLIFRCRRFLDGIPIWDSFN